MPDDWVNRISSFYNSRIQQYGYDLRAIDYGSPRSQQIRFKTLAQVGMLTGKRILDVGCGFADFATYLEQHDENINYVGVDITQGAIQEAQRLHPNLLLRIMNILEEDPGAPFDLVTANGIFYLLGKNAQVQMQQIVTRMFELSRSMVAFSTLSSYAPHQESGEFYADPLETLRFCRTLTPWVVLRHDYLPHDFTIYLYREQQNT